MKMHIVAPTNSSFLDARMRGARRGVNYSYSRIFGTIALSTFIAFPDLVDAQTVTGGASPAAMINNICTFILGPFGQSLAVLGIIAIGLSWMFGRVSLGLIAGVIGGIVIMFGASYLGSTLTGGGGG